MSRAFLHETQRRGREFEGGRHGRKQEENYLKVGVLWIGKF